MKKIKIEAISMTKNQVTAAVWLIENTHKSWAVRLRGEPTHNDVGRLIAEIIDVIEYQASNPNWDGFWPPARGGTAQS